MVYVIKNQINVELKVSSSYINIVRFIDLMFIFLYFIQNLYKNKFINNERGTSLYVSEIDKILNRKSIIWSMWGYCRFFWHLSFCRQINLFLYRICFYLGIYLSCLFFRRKTIFIMFWIPLF